MSARLLFIGTWNFADDSGNLDRSAKQIKARVFPIDKVNCEPLIQELLAVGLLIEYSVSDKKYLHIQKFHKHQVINRPSKPTCPAFEEALITHGTLSEDSALKGREGKGSKDTAVSRKIPLPPGFGISDAVRAWATVKGHTNLEARLEHFIGWAKSKGHKYADWDQTFQNAIRDDWAKLGDRPPPFKREDGLALQ